MVNINGQATTLRGINYNHKPYVDDGSPLPQIGERVRNLTDGPTIEGVVEELDGSRRRLRIKGFKSWTVKGNWQHEDFDNWVLWQDFVVTTENNEAVARSRAGLDE